MSLRNHLIAIALSCSISAACGGIDADPDASSVDAAADVDAAAAADADPADPDGMPDIIAPNTTIDSGPPLLGNDADAVFTFSSNEIGSTFQCRVDSDAFAACTTPFGATVSEGPHTFEVYAIDMAANPDVTPAMMSWTVDLTAPDTAIDSGPSGAVSSATGTFTFSSPDASATFECRFDGAGFAVCASPAVYSSLAEGAHDFEVRAVDEAGNIDPTPAMRAWTVDTVAPDTTITGTPADPSGVDSATFTFTSPDGSATFECNLDGAGFAVCASPAEYSSLAEGAHDFEVRAVDTAGNIDPTPSSYGWTIIIAPDTTLLSAPLEATNKDTAEFIFSSPDGSATFECNLDGAGFAACTSPVAYSSLGLGVHDFAVRAVSAGGTPDPTPESHSWTVTSAPLLHYRFDGDATNSGAIAGYDGAESSVTYQTGKIGEAVVFGDSATSLVTLPGTRTVLSAGFDYTIGLWFREDTVLNFPPARRLLDFRGSTGGLETYHGASGTALYTCYSSDPSGGTCRSFTYVVGDWHHLLYRYDGTSTSPGGGAPLEIYLDGALVTTIPNADGNVIFSSGQLVDIVLGKETNFYLDDLRVYDQVFTEAEQCAVVLGGVWAGSSCTLP